MNRREFLKTISVVCGLAVTGDVSELLLTKEILDEFVVPWRSIGFKVSNDFSLVVGDVVKVIVKDWSSLYKIILIFFDGKYLNVTAEPIIIDRPKESIFHYGIVSPEQAEREAKYRLALTRSKC